MIKLLLLILLLALSSIVNSYHIHSSSINSNSRHIRLLRYNKDNDFIDAEIIDNTQKSSSSSLSSDKKPTKGIISSVFNFGKKLFTNNNDDSKLSVVEKKKKEQKEQMNSMIDEAFKGTGLVGGLFGSVIKGVGGMITDSIADASKDQDFIQEAIINKLSSSSIASSKIGNDIRCGFPLQSSSSSFNINGNVQKQFSQVIQVQGSRGVGTVQAAGTIDSNGSIKFNQLLLQDNTSMITDLLLKGSGGAGSGTIIDTDAY
jgi:hypothetical protein